MVGEVLASDKCHFCPARQYNGFAACWGCYWKLKHEEQTVKKETWIQEHGGK
jgi:hypothetical protein